MWRRSLGCTACMLSAITFGASGARGAGYALKEQSTKAQGNAFAGATAGAEDVSYMFFNPAALGWVDRIETQVGASWISPRSELKDSSASTITGAPIGGRSSRGDIGQDAVVPFFYAAAPVGGGVTAGLGVNVPYGLETRYPDGWVGRYHGVQSRLETVNINPALAWRPREWLALGGGFQAQYANGRLTNAIDYGTIGLREGIPGAVPGAQDGFARLRGNDWSYGWNAGALVEPRPGTKLGVAWRSDIEHRLEGRVSFRDDEAGIAQFIRSQRGFFADTNAELELHTPQTLSFGVHQAVTDKVAVMAEAQWTDWSVFDQLTIEIDNPGQPSSVTEEEWDDTWFFALGSTYDLNDAWTLRGGIAYDQSPVKDRFRTPRIPDEDRYWLSVGAGYEPSDWLSLDATFTYIWLDDSEVQLLATDKGNAARGNLDAEYESSIMIVGLSASLRF